MPLSKREFKELRRAAMRAIKTVQKLISEEPSVVIITGHDGAEPECPVDEITRWLFHRRQDSDHADS